jgi:hypothetical protein
MAIPADPAGIAGVFMRQLAWRRRNAGISS